MAISLGDVNFALGADTRALAKSVSTLRSFGKEVEKAAQSQVTGSKAAAAAMRKQERSIVSAIKKVQDLNAVTRRTGAGAENLSAANRSLKAYTKTLTQGKLSALEFQRAQARLDTSLGNVRRRLNDVVSKKASKGMTDLSDRMRDLSSIAILAHGPLGGLAARISAFGAATRRAGLATAAFIGGIALAAVGVTKLGTATLRSARQIDRVKSSLEAVTGSARVANLAFKEIVGIANTTGQAIGGLALQYARFTAASAGTALQGKATTEIFNSVAAVASKLQLPMEQSSGIFKALEQIMSKGTVQAEELRGQLGDRLPGAFKIAADAVGKTTSELGEMMKAGQLMSEDFLPKFIVQLKKVFNIDGSNIDNFQASLNRLSNEWLLLLNHLDETLGLSTAVKSAMDGVANALSFVRTNLVTVMKALGAVAGGLVALSAGSIITGLLVVGRAIRAGAIAMWALNAAMLANPIGGFVLLLSRLAVALTGAVIGFNLMDAAMGDSSNAAEEVGKDVDDLISTMDQLDGGVGTLGQSLRNKLIDTLHTLQVSLIDTRMELDLLNASMLRQLNPFGASSKEMEADIHRLEGTIIASKERLAKLDDRLQKNAAKPKITASPKKGKKKKGPTASDIKRQKEALESVNQTLARQRLQLEALGRGGLKAFEELNKAFALEDKVDRFAQSLEQAGIKGDEASQKIQDFRDRVIAIGEVTKKLNEQKVLTDSLTSAAERGMARIGDAIGDMVAQGKFDLSSFADIFKAIVADIIKTIIQLKVIKPITNSILGSFGLGNAGAGGGASGGTGVAAARTGMTFGSQQPVRKMAKGGLINRPTIFQSSEGPVLGGEAGTEAIMPLRKNGKGELGIMSHGGNGGGGGTTQVASSNIFVDARGADQGVVQSLQRSVQEMNRTFNKRSASAAEDAKLRRVKFL